MSYALHCFHNIRRWTLFALFSLFAFSNVAVSTADQLTIGSKAPELDVEYWVSDRDGEFEHTTEFEEGKVYVVEFWATWCGPCIASMPHLAELQDEFVKKGVQLISISDEKLSKVEKFLMKDVRGEEDLTYGQLTGAYCLTTDPDGSVFEDYMIAAGQSGIPTAFIVGKSGLIEWIGHPMRMDEPLAKVVEGNWDREKFAVGFKKGQEFEKLASKLVAMMQDDQPKEALTELDEFMSDLDKDSGVYRNCGSLRMELAMRVGGTEALAAFKKMTAKSKNAMMINQFAWNIVEQVRAGDEVEEELLEAACMAAKKAVALAREDGDDEMTAAVLDTHANLLFLCDKLDDALAVQKEAIGMSDDEQLADFYDLLLETKEDLEEENDSDDDSKDDKSETEEDKSKKESGKKITKDKKDDASN